MKSVATGKQLRLDWTPSLHFTERGYFNRIFLLFIFSTAQINYPKLELWHDFIPLLGCVVSHRLYNYLHHPSIFIIKAVYFMSYYVPSVREYYIYSVAVSLSFINVKLLLLFWPVYGFISCLNELSYNFNKKFQPVCIEKLLNSN